MLSDAVENGRGKGARIVGWDGSGKTGTTKKVINGEDSASEFLASFVGFFPKEYPQLLALIIIDGASVSSNYHWGSMSAAPVFKSVMQRIINIDKEITDKKFNKKLKAKNSDPVLLQKNDKKKEHRQIIVVNAKGQTYVFSGLRTINICDSYMEDNFAIAGNMLASTSVISSMKTAFLNNSNVFFPKRLLLTLIAGENAGGDKRGCMSAAIEYFKPNRRIMTLRIDYSNNPLKDLSMALEKRYSKECKDAFDR